MQRERRSFAKAPSCKMCSPWAAQGSMLFMVFVLYLYSFSRHPMESSKAIFQGQMVNNCQVTTEDLQEMERVVRTDFSKTLVGSFTYHCLRDPHSGCIPKQRRHGIGPTLRTVENTIPNMNSWGSDCMNSWGSDCEVPELILAT